MGFYNSEIALNSRRHRRSGADFSYVRKRISHIVKAAPVPQQGNASPVPAPPELGGVSKRLGYDLVGSTSHRQRDTRRAIANLNTVDRVGLAPVLCDPQEILSKQFEPLFLYLCVTTIAPHFEH